MTSDAIIAGGGMAGLCLAIDLARRGYRVTLFEKGDYPRHKVCGEYISLEAMPWLKHLCPALDDLDFPIIKTFRLTSLQGSEVRLPLPLGGAGISRYRLENLLYEQAQALQVDVRTNTAVKDRSYDTTTGFHTANNVQAPLYFDATGRAAKGVKEKVNYVGVKYHVKLQRDPELIEIHNFPGGYCGISAIEGDLNCLCYLVNSARLRENDNDLGRLERSLLSRNPALKAIFDNIEVIEGPSTISNISFGKKAIVRDHVFYLGDAAGCMAPVTGNGMSMAIRSAAQLGELAALRLEGKITTEEMAARYIRYWHMHFGLKIRHTRLFQRLSESAVLAHYTTRLFRHSRYLASKIIAFTHGQAF